MRTARLDRIESNTRKQRQRESDNCLEGYAGILPPFQRVRASACVISREEKRGRERRKKRERESGQSWSSVKKISVCREARNAISRSPDVDESCQREMCFGNSGWKRLRNGGRRKRENEQTRFGKVFVEREKERDRPDQIGFPKLS